MEFINILNIIIFVSIGFIHFYWAFGGKFLINIALPTKDGKKLLNPSNLLTFIVGLVLLGFAFVTLNLVLENTNILYIYLGWIITSIFLLRAIGEFNMIGFFKKIKGTPFANYDTKYFSPLCLYLSLSLAILLLSK